MSLRYSTVRKRQLQRKYGISLADYDILLNKQDGVCLICGQKDLDKFLAVDHCHETGRIRGLLCNGCNSGLGHFKDDPELLKRAILYLGKCLETPRHSRQDRF